MSTVPLKTVGAMSDPVLTLPTAPCPACGEETELVISWHRYRHVGGELGAPCAGGGRPPACCGECGVAVGSWRGPGEGVERAVLHGDCRGSWLPVAPPAPPVECAGSSKPPEGEPQLELMIEALPKEDNNA